MVLLCIDDDFDDIEIFADAVRSIADNCHLLVANSGLRALELLDECQKPDFIFLDINMPGINGLETLKLIRSNKKLKDIPVIIYSTTQDDREISKSKQIGASQFLRKPNSFTELCAALNSILNNADKYQSR